MINVGSIAAELTHTGSNTPSYEASKAAVESLTRYLSAQLVNDAICVNNIQPAVFASKMTKFMLQNKDMENMVAERHPMKRIGNESDMAGIALYLGSKASAFTTGVSISVDGGKVAIRSKL